MECVSYRRSRCLTNGDNANPTPQQDVLLSAQPQKACEIRSAPRGAGEQIKPPEGQQDLTAQGGPVEPSFASTEARPCPKTDP